MLGVLNTATTLRHTHQYVRSVPHDPLPRLARISTLASWLPSGLEPNGVFATRVYQRVLFSMAVNYRKLEAHSLRNPPYQIISFGTRSQFEELRTRSEDCKSNSQL